MMKTQQIKSQPISRSEQKKISGGTGAINWCCGYCTYEWGSELIVSRSCFSVAKICNMNCGYLNDCYCDETCIP